MKKKVGFWPQNAKNGEKTPKKCQKTLFIVLQKIEAENPQKSWEVNYRYIDTKALPKIQKIFVHSSKSVQLLYYKKSKTAKNELM